ncbi:MAG: DUF1592 domain-containing protein [Phycisphaera sp.]|nr:DUF1592 domain-containing protein [Phycisphaera sp.]
MTPKRKFHFGLGTRHPGHTAVFVAGVVVLALLATATGRAEEPGESIYMKRCASCHGKTGGGVKGEYSKPLVGDKTVPQLTNYVTKSMPDDKPEQCVGKDAEAVSRYIYDAFYSPIAQARHRPPRIELSRLTVTQHRNVVADLIGSFRRNVSLDKRDGLRAEFFKGRSMGRDRLEERIEPSVLAHFDKSNPLYDRFDPKGFSARWSGALVAPETGNYEFILKSDHAVRLWLNQDGRGNRDDNEFSETKDAFIDAWVKSGNQIEYRGTIFLIAGQVYPLAVEFSCHSQGVGDEKEHKSKLPEHSFVELWWRPPHREVEVVPARVLSPTSATEVCVLNTPFPPDDRSVGYERGSSVSKAWADATTGAAIEVADYVVGHMYELSNTRIKDDKRDEKVRAFAATFVERAFRRPLTDFERRLYVDKQFEGADDIKLGLKRVVMLTMESPRFLYHNLGGDEDDAYAQASRLSFALWDSLPDRQLLDAAAKGQLAKPDQVARQAQRMLDDPRCHAKVRQFMHYWLDIEQVPDMAKDKEQFKGFDAAVTSDLRTSLDLFLDDVVWNGSGDFRQLLTSDAMYVNGRLGAYYGVNLPKDAPFEKVAATTPKRVGVLTHPYVLARFAYPDATSPIHRGVFIVRSVLGRALRPPPKAVAPLAPDLHPGMTTRQRVTLQTEPKACQACHGMINALGFTLEQFDAVGRFRDKEFGKPIDARGAYELPTGKVRNFNDAYDLASFLAESEETHDAFVMQLFHHLAKQSMMAYGQDKAEQLRRDFAAHGYNIRDLIVNAAVTIATTAPDRPKAEAKSN